MTTDLDWQHEIDEAVGRAPDRPADGYVIAGHRAVRRRRAAAGVAGLAVVAVLGGLGWAALPGAGSPGSEGLPVATDPRPADPASLADSPDDVREAEPGEIEDFGAPGMMAVTALGSGQLVHAPGWTVDRLEVLRARDHKRVWALALSSDDADEGQWVRLTWRPTGVGAIWDPPKDRMTFDEWADVIWAEAQGKEVPAALLVDDRVEPGPGVIVLEAILHPEEAAAFGPVQDRAAALLELRDGTRVYALVTRSGSTVVDPAELPEDTLAGFLAHLESVGESGGDL